MKKPKAIVFDYGDTLLKSEFFRPIEGVTELLKYAHNPEGVTAKEIQDYADQVLKDLGAFDQQLLFQIDSKSLSRLIYEVHGISFDLSYEELDSIFLSKTEGTSLMPGIVELLDYLTDSDIRVAVLSNTGFCEESHRMQLRKHDIEKYFEFFIPTTDYLLRKPDKRVFDLALKRLSLTNDEVWYIGNKFEFDIIGANNAGMFPVWINVEQEEPHLDLNHLNVSSYEELLKLLKEKWNK